MGLYIFYAHPNFPAGPVSVNVTITYAGQEKSIGYLIIGLAFIVVGGLILGLLTHVIELSCSLTDDMCTIVKTSPVCVDRTTFRLSRETGY